VPTDVCFHCHEGIAESRPSHEGMGFDTCASAGCHNYHDNRALYEDFLLTHAQAPDFLAEGRVALRWLDQYSPDQYSLDQGRGAPTPLAMDDQDAPAGVAFSAQVLDDWAHSAHAQTGVNCTSCHAASDGVWIDAPDHNGCTECHATEVKGFLSGMHGMRLAAGLSPMRPEQARLPMQDHAHGLELSCTSCHGDHGFNTVTAAVDACLGCHADQHSLAYVDSPHHLLWQQELAGEGEAGTGVSCATCHMPREIHRRGGADVVVVQHNQNSNLRPVEQMARTACMSCHGLSFTLDALADPVLRANNFRGRPAAHVPSIQMAEERLQQQQQRRRQ